MASNDYLFENDTKMLLLGANYITGAKQPLQSSLN